MIANVSLLARELRRHAETKGPITVGLAGAGQMGTDLVVQLGRMPGLRLGAISEITGSRAKAALLLAGYHVDNFAEARSTGDIDRLIEANKIAITQDFAALAQAGRVDVVIDATGSPETGAAFALAAINQGKPIVMLNVEADITIGRFLNQEARRAGVIYTDAAGDEPAAQRRAHDHKAAATSRSGRRPLPRCGELPQALNAAKPLEVHLNLPPEIGN